MEMEGHELCWFLRDVGGGGGSGTLCGNGEEKSSSCE